MAAIVCRPKATIIRPGSSLRVGGVYAGVLGEVYCCIVVCFRSIYMILNGIRVLLSLGRSYYRRGRCGSGKEQHSRLIDAVLHPVERQFCGQN